ncbi:hypothetical protein DSO57_1016549 [Entomophthora muscae]|uniref:Uncharacterized protein n=1 Tax=Entomophthora muscae TaxID=34485 RepID=A0ACC2RJG8_9FUNG|nr:hypothetical protein DSO57_1016549 [Entomophthora muscae]
MSGLLVDWTLYTPVAEIPDGFVLYQNMVIPLPTFNALSAQGFFQAPASMPRPTNKSAMPAYVPQRLQSVALEPFARANNNNAATWIQYAQSKLAQMECPQQFWIAEISIHLTHDAGTWCNKWHKEHTDKNWDTFKQYFLAIFVLKDTALMIIHQVKNLTQTGTVKELTCAYKYRNIPDNTLVQDNILCTIKRDKQNKKWQQFPLIGETAAKSWGQETKIKNKNFNLDRFYTPSAGRTPNCQTPAASQPPPPTHSCQPVPHPGRQMGKPKKAISPNPNRGGTAA